MTNLALFIGSADWQCPERVATPMIMAQAASALDARVELYFSSLSVELLRVEFQDRLVGYGPERRSIGHYLATLSSLGIEVLACGQAMRALSLSQGDLHPSCRGVAGAVSFMARVLDAEWCTLVF